MSIVDSPIIQKRELRFDILRIIATIGVILAHVDPPKWISQLRNFDVPLIIIVSGAVFSLSSGTSLSYTDYLKKRVLRIVIPVWLFFTMYFAFSILFAKATGVPVPFSTQTMFMTYLFQISFGGIVYVWLLYVFLIMALLMPLIYRIHRRYTNHQTYLLGIVSCFFLYLLLLWGRQHFLGTLSPETLSFIDFDILLIIPYACLAAFGLRLPFLPQKTVQYIGVSSLLIFVVLAAWHHHFQFPQHWGQFVWTQKFKYPPQPYFLSYALTLSIAAYLLVSRLASPRPSVRFFLETASRATLWVYLWHIFYLSTSKHLPWSDLPSQRFPFVVLISFGTAMFQHVLAKRAMQKLPPTASKRRSLLQYFLS